MADISKTKLYIIFPTFLLSLHTAVFGIISNYSRIPCHEGVLRAVNFILFVLFSRILTAGLSLKADIFGIIGNYSRIPAAWWHKHTAIYGIIGNYSRIPATRRHKHTDIPGNISNYSRIPLKHHKKPPPHYSNKKPPRWYNQRRGFILIQLFILKFYANHSFIRSNYAIVIPLTASQALQLHFLK